MRAHILLAFSFCTAFQALSQNAPVAPAPDLPKDPHAVFAMAAPLYDFNDPTLKPWHLKASYQLYDEKGRPTEPGTYEYWWASPKVHRASWTRVGATRTDWTTPDSIIHRKESGGPFRHFERTLGTALLYPLPARSLSDSGRTILDLKMMGEGKARLACVTASFQWEQNGVLKAPPSAVPQYYCFDPPTMALLMTYRNTITTEYSHIVKTQGRYLARQIAVHIGKQEVFSASVDVIEDTDPSAPELAPSADSLVVQEAVSQPEEDQPLDNVKIGSLVKKTQPVYPIVARSAHEQGTVVLAATIGTEGKIHDLEVLESPSPMLRDSAVDAVKRWEYSPYLLNGKPVEVETIVKVTFSLGG